MSTILNTNGTELEVPQLLDAANFKCAVFTAEWNAEVTDALLKGVMDTFAKARVDPDNIFSQPVPGTVELVNAAGMAMRHLQDLSAIIILGCVVRGDTPHFDYVCQVVRESVAGPRPCGRPLRQQGRRSCGGSHQDGQPPHPLRRAALRLVPTINPLRI